MKPNLAVVNDRSRKGSSLRPHDPRAVANLASALNAAFQIKPGRELVLALGSGHEESNIEALETWVRESLERYGIAPTRQGLAILISELERKLSIWEHDQRE